MRSVIFVALAVFSCGGAAPPSKSEPTAPAKPDPAPPPEPSVNAKTSIPSPQTHLFELDDAAFFEDDAVGATASVRKQLIRAGARGVRIDAPFSVDAGTHASVPMIGFVATDAGADASFRGWVVGVQQGKSGFQVARPSSPKMPAGGKASPSKGGKTSPSKGSGKIASSPAPKPKGGGVVSSPFAHDARALLDQLDWADASVRLYAVQGQHLSNGVTVRVRGGTSTVPREPSPAASESGAAAGDGPLALDGPAEATTEPGGTVMLTGHVRGAERAAEVYLFAVADGPAGPFENKLEVALEDGVGTFEINLLGDNALPKAPGTWHVYAFSGEHAAGPVTIELRPGAKPW